MFRYISIILVILSVSVAAWAEAELLTFRAYPAIERTDHCRLEWTTGQETNLRVFIVERSGDGSYFLPVGQVAANGSYSEYQFADLSPLDADMNRTFFYRLRMVDHSGATRYSEIREVSLQFSAVQQTWGTIKAMFR